MNRLFTVFALAAPALAVVAGCTSVTHSVGIGPRNTDQPAGGSGGATCAIYDRSHDARVSVSGGGADSECAELAKDLTTTGDFWTGQYQPPRDSLSMVCVMDKGGYVAEVDDSSTDQVIGQEVCSGFLQSGWQEDQTVEQQRSAAASSEAAAAASAAASASASQAQQEKINGDVKALSTDYGTLSSDADTIGPDLQSMANDAGSADTDTHTTHTDLQTVLTDAKTPSNNQDGTTCTDAAGVNTDADGVATDADGISTDLDGLSRDLQTVRADLTTLQDALNTVQQDIPGYDGGANTPSPNAVQQKLTATRSKIASAVSTANGQIDHVNADVAQAFRDSAAASAAGNCGSASAAPTPVAHIS